MLVKARPVGWRFWLKASSIVAVLSTSFSALSTSGVASFGRIDEVGSGNQTSTTSASGTKRNPRSISESPTAPKDIPVLTPQTTQPPQQGPTRRETPRTYVLKHPHNQVGKPRHEKLGHPTGIRRSPTSMQAPQKFTGTRSNQTGPLGSIRRPHAISTSPKRHLSPSSRERRIIYIGRTSGGLGKQERFILQHLDVVVKNRLEFVMPSATNRDSTLSAGVDEYWDVTYLQRNMLPLVVHRRVPRECDLALGGRLDARVTINASEPSGTGAKIVSSSLSSGSGIHVLVPEFGLANIPSVREFLMNALESRPKPLFRLNGTAPICVRADGNTNPTAWNLGRLIKPSQKYLKQAEKLPLSSIAFLHLRYDGQIGSECLAGPPKGRDPSRNICIQMPSDGVEWIPVASYARALSQLIHRTPGLRTIKYIYVTHPTHMPPITWQRLQATLSEKTGLGIFDNPANTKNGAELNFVERAVAFRSKLLISEARSAWSSTLAASRPNSTVTINAWKLVSKYSDTY